MQCRVTTEDPSKDFSPDTGVLEVFRMPGGMGIRLDDGPGFPGAIITPHYDSLLVKVTAHARTRLDCARKLSRSLKEFRVRGVSTNKSFLLGVLEHDDFVNGVVNTSFIADNPQLLKKEVSDNRGTKLLSYIANITVNGPPEVNGFFVAVIIILMFLSMQSLGAVGARCSRVAPILPQLHNPPFSDTQARCKPSLRSIYVKEGPKAFAKAVREHPGLLITDTTWRDAHQSLLATRLRTHDILKIAPATAIGLANAYSLENWGGATFDVSMRFLKECPWQRLELMREAVPDIPFQVS